MTREELTTKEAIRSAWLDYRDACFRDKRDGMAYGDWYRCYMDDVEMMLKHISK